jgi:AcrR family transcriptional regulator
MDQSIDMESRILNAAAQLFAERGFHGTTTREIAKLAGINETSLFRHIPRKQEMFWAAMQLCFSQLRPSEELQTGLIEKRPPAAVMPLIVQYLHEIASHRQLIRLLLFSLLELCPRAEELCREKLGPVFRMLFEYLEHYSGNRNDPRDTSILAVGICATVLTHENLLHLLAETHGNEVSTKEAISAYVSFCGRVLSFAPTVTLSAANSLATSLAAGGAASAH